MRAVIQRVKEAAVSIDKQVTASIQAGLLVFAGIESGDSMEDVQWLAAKIANMRIFGRPGDQRMNDNLQDIDGDILLVSQFTLHALVKKGNRPSFIKAARPEQAIPLYEALIRELEEKTGKKIATGEFGADMDVRLINDGPVTIIIDSKNKE